MSSASKLLERARTAGLAAEHAERLQRELIPRVESFLASVPDLPPTDQPSEQRLLVGLVEVYLPSEPLIISALDSLVDAMSASLDDLFDPDPSDRVKRRSLHHLEEALASLVRIGAAAAALVARHRELGPLATPGSEHVIELVDELRPYLRGLLATLVGLDRLDEDVERMAPWAWMARRETLRSEGLLMVAMHELEPPPPDRPHRLPGDWKGRVTMSDDFDAPLPKDIEDSFYDPAL